MFKGKKGKNTKTVLIVTGIVLASGTVSGITIGNMYSNRMQTQKAKYEEALLSKDNELKRYQLSSKKGYVVSQHLDAGDVIEESDVTLMDMPDYFVSTDVITDKEAVIGKVIKLSSEPNTPITKQMVYEDGPLDPSERKIEIDYVRLPIKVDPKDRLDVMIVYPNGEKYRVLTKKKMESLDLPNQMMFVNLNIEENYLITSALVDAYIQKAELVAEQYVEPEMQEAAIETYYPNLDVIKVLKADPDIANKSRYAIAEDVRASLNARLAAMDQADKYRIGAELPEGSAVSKRKQAVGATIVGNAGNSATPADGAATPSSEEPQNPSGYTPPGGAEGSEGKIGE